jgi:DNA repair protein RecN (Recombination protein N)
MLSELRIANLAVVENVTVRFRPGLNALTGETGAGKSLIVGAIDLVLGARGSAELVRQGAAEAEITARFEIDTTATPAERLDPALFEDGTLVLHRVVTADGRSRAYVNDRPVTLGRLRELGKILADLHGQHEQQNLLDESSHLEYLDRMAGTASLLEPVRVSYGALVAARAARDALIASLQRGQEEREFLRYQFEELERAELREGETEALTTERHRAAHAGRLAENVGAALAAASEADPGAVGLLAQASRALGQAAGLDGALDPLLRQLDEALVSVEDVARELRLYLERLEDDPARLNWIETRLALLSGLERKHHRDEEGLIQRREELRELLAGMEDAPARLEDLEREVARRADELRAHAATLTAARSRSAAAFSRRVTRELAGLGMQGARFKVDFHPPRQGLDIPGLGHPVNARGAEEAVFVLAANPGEKEGSLSRAASGGELSRTMLALKNVLRAADPVPVVIFDEVDAGIGGLIAEAVGTRLAAIAEERQVLVVTHLAVIAGRAGHHLRLIKTTRRERTSIQVETLEGRAREEELARMLAGSAGGDAARKTARALLGEREHP